MTNTISTSRRGALTTTKLRGEYTESIHAEAGPVVDYPDVRTGETGVDGKDADAVTDVHSDTGKTTRRNPVDALGGLTPLRLRVTRDRTTAGSP